MLDQMYNRPVLNKGEGHKTVRVIGDTVMFKALASQTNGAYSLFETTTPPGAGTPPHYQRDEDEAFFVLEGEYTFLHGEEQKVVTAGSFVFVPRGTMHMFTNTGDLPARMLIITTPGGIHEKFFESVGEPVDAPPSEPNFPEIVQKAESYGIIIPPPPAE